ncbi:MAG: TnpV protein [Eubacteriales bacterium]|nr:TnpV protein [Eubacteriales bacterium]
MQKHIVDEVTGIPYTLVGDYYLPFGDMPDEERQHHIGIWGQRHLQYIRKNKKSLYASLLTSGKLNGHLADIDKHADEMFSRLVKEMAAKQGITEQLKAGDQMAWVGAMNNIRNSATEIVNHDLIYG